MPIRLTSSRREFLAATLVAGSSLAFAAEAKASATRYALLADTHIPAKAAFETRGVNMVKNLQNVVRQLTALEQRPAAAMILGDCAYLDGQQEDYQQLKKQLLPLGERGWTIHLALGNHDHRQHCVDAFPAKDGPLVAEVERRVAVIPGEQANWFLLDSLDKVNVTPGILGEQQLNWLTEALDRHADRPALIGVHHNPMSSTINLAANVTGKISGLVDTTEFLKILTPRRFVKAVFFGHTHAWSVVEHAGIHLVNLPPVAYTFAKEKPNGWTDCLVHADRAELTLHCHDTMHANHGRTVELKWRKES